MTEIIGITGGIGSGKTTIARYMESLGVPLYIADEEARKIMESQLIKEQLREKFGDLIFEGSFLRRDQLAAIVFTNPEKLKELNAIIHPAVKTHFEQWLKKHKNDAFVLYEAAILFESGGYKKCNHIVTIVAPVDLRIKRVISRDKTNQEAVEERINAQWTDEQRVLKSDFIIENVDLDKAKNKAAEILKILRIKQKPS
jgi:dephospho-CoA kinase